MRTGRLAGLLVLLTGCFSDTAALVSDGPWNRLKGPSPLLSPDTVELLYLRLDGPATDPRYREDVWRQADENAVPLDLKQRLRQNGLRIAKLGQRLSPELQALVREVKGQDQARSNTSFSGRVVKVEVTPVVPRMSLFSFRDGQPRGQELVDAQGYFYLTPSIDVGSTVRLAVYAEVEQGEKRRKMEASPDLVSFNVRNDRDHVSFPELKTDLVLQSGDFVLIGGDPDRPGTLGANYFSRYDLGDQRVSLLLIRVIRPTPEQLARAGAAIDDFWLSAIDPTSKGVAPTAGPAPADDAPAAGRTAEPGVDEAPAAETAAPAGPPAGQR